MWNNYWRRGIVWRKIIEEIGLNELWKYVNSMKKVGKRSIFSDERNFSAQSGVFDYGEECTSFFSRHSFYCLCTLYIDLRKTSQHRVHSLTYSEHLWNFSLYILIKNILIEKEFSVSKVPCLRLCNCHRFRWYATLENKTTAETFAKFPLVFRVVDRSDRNPPITATSVTFRPSLRHACGLWSADFDPICR